MKDRALIATGAIGVVLAAICCAAPLLAVMLATASLTAWLAAGAYVLIPVLLICLALIGLRFRRRQTAAAAQTRRLTNRSENRERLRRAQEGQRQGL